MSLTNMCTKKAKEMGYDVFKRKGGDGSYQYSAFGQTFVAKKTINIDGVWYSPGGAWQWLCGKKREGEIAAKKKDTCVLCGFSFSKGDVFYQTLKDKAFLAKKDSWGNVIQECCEECAVDNIN